VGIAALALLVIGGLFFALSRVQYRVQIVGGRVEVVPVGTETVVPAETPTGAVVAATAMAAATPQPTAATSPTPTRTKLPPGYASPGDPPDEGRVVEYCENVGLGTGLCIFPYKGGAHTTILEDAGLYFDKDGSLSWNPNGQRIAFAAATAPDEHPDIYTVNADGSDMTSITFDDEVNHNPAWSPDDEWIAFQRNGDLAIVRPDGSDLTVIQRQISDGPCFAAPHWSPDSQWIAVYAMVNGCPPTSPLTREVWIISRDGQTVNVVTPPQVYEDVSSIGGRFAFSPGGSQLAYTDEQERSRIVRVDGSAEPEFLTNWPDWWAHNFWPQWDGEEATTAPTLIPVSSADQARAFAEPILAAIADRPPDFEDDFGDQASGWSIGSNDDGDEWGYENEAYSILVAPGYRDAGVPPDYPLELSDFVLEVDGQFVSGEWGHWYVSFRHSLGSIEQPASAGDYAVKFYPDSSFDLWKNVGETSRELIRETAVYAPTFEQGTGMNRLTIIAQGPQIAIYMNGEPLCFVRDESLKKGTILLAATNETNDTPLRVHFDNLKVWDISDLELPSAETTPAPQPTAAPIPTRTPVPVGQCRIAYEQGGDVYVRNCDGSGVLRLTDRPAGDWLPAWSPDGTQIVFCSDHHAIGEGRNQLYMMDADGSNLTRLTNTESNDEHPSWSPDGSRIAFHSGCALAVINADGANRTTLVEARDDLCVGFPTWSPDSRRIAFRSLVSSGDTGFYQHDIYVVDDGGSGILKLASFTSEERGQYVVWSPDGSRVAFDILLDGQWKYYAVNSDGSEEPVEIASIPDSWYSWYWPQWGGE